MRNVVISFLEFFGVLSVLFFVCSFLSLVVMKRLSLGKLVLDWERAFPGLGNVMSAFIGAVTPFCVCTTIPVFTGMLQTGVAPNIALSFLFSSPLISISSAALLYFLFGARFCVYYLVATLVFSVGGGLLARRLRYDDQICPQVTGGPSCGEEAGVGLCRPAVRFSLQLFRYLLSPLLIGALFAGLIHNYVPVRLIDSINRYPLWVVIPLAALIGFPIYSNIMVLAPICFVLASQGMNQGAVMAFLMAGAGISFPTVIVLRRIFKTRLLVYYVVYTYLSYCAIAFIFSLMKAS